MLVLCGATLVIYTALTRDWSVWRRLYLLPGLAMLLAIVERLVRARRATQPRIPRVLFRARAPRALPDDHSPSRRAVVVLPAAHAARNRAMAGSAAAGCAGQCLACLRQRPGFRPALFALLWCGVVIAFFSASRIEARTVRDACGAHPGGRARAADRRTETGPCRARAYVTGGLLLLAGIGLVVAAQRRAPTHVVPASVVLWSCARVRRGRRGNRGGAMVAPPRTRARRVAGRRRLRRRRLVQSHDGVRVHTAGANVASRS